MPVMDIPGSARSWHGKSPHDWAKACDELLQMSQPQHGAVAIERVFPAPFICQV